MWREGASDLWGLLDTEDEGQQIESVEADRLRPRGSAAGVEEDEPATADDLEAA